MNTSKFDTLAMAAETRAKMPVNEDEAVDMSISEVVNASKAEISKHPGGEFNDAEAESISAHPRYERQSSPTAARRTPAGRGRPRRSPTFAEKLHAILDDRSLSSIVTWLPSGKSFCIINKDAFTRIVLPKYFKESLFESFSRRLKRWGYRKVYTAGQKQIVIIHDLFQRGRMDLCKMMNGRASQSVKVVSQDVASGKANINEDMIQELALAEKSLQSHRSAKGAPEKKKEPQVNPQPQLPQMSQGQTIMAHPAAPVFINRAHHVVAGTGNFALQADLPVNYQHHYGVRAPVVPYNGAAHASVVRQLHSLDEEIEECQEQLAILHRLRTLREMRERRRAFH